jgi:ABC-type glucose/galactose transport system permease subunit
MTIDFTFFEHNFRIASLRMIICRVTPTVHTMVFALSEIQQLADRLFVVIAKSCQVLMKQVGEDGSQNDHIATGNIVLETTLETRINIGRLFEEMKSDEM